MDPSALIFVALAVAWAAYLIPKALEHHDAGARTRTVTTFSERIRVLARREAISRRKSALVPATPPSAPGSMPAKAVEPAAAHTPEVTDEKPVEVIVEEILLDSLLETTQSGRLHLPSGGQAKRPPISAARRRRRVLGVLIFLFAATAATAAGQVISWAWLAVPAAVIVAWLVACRLMVRNERKGARSPGKGRSLTAGSGPAHTEEESAALTVAVLEADATTDIPVITEPLADGTWEPVQAPLPTYVTKTAAPRRTVTIDLDSTGVWTSGRTEADSALAREADAVRAAAVTSAEQATQRRASGA
ncbi:hypothetical protein [Nocardioides sp. Kera G14]|uniref:divisome protein SepX/GlpR n=1 Tax=Nocardioides sp. Kera G14 TaxID=2884264 RepID=UPI001D11C759|nr:hypothetical protein [Nocardioides sp. Kera G14]UDY24107.1 hypothetical protein LH076_02075 [Nocardioides sp. Kera G14]